MMRMVLGAVWCALALAAGSASDRADGALNSLSDLDGGGAQNWHYIAPRASTDKTPADVLTNAAAAPHGGTSAAAGHKITQIDENLTIEPPPPPPKKPVSSLWFSPPPGSK
jgi:hypothetical protein